MVASPAAIPPDDHMRDCLGWRAPVEIPTSLRTSLADPVSAVKSQELFRPASATPARHGDRTGFPGADSVKFYAAAANLQPAGKNCRARESADPAARRQFRKNRRALDSRAFRGIAVTPGSSIIPRDTGFTSPGFQHQPNTHWFPQEQLEE